MGREIEFYARSIRADRRYEYRGGCLQQDVELDLVSCVPGSEVQLQQLQRLVNGDTVVVISKREHDRLLKIEASQRDPWVGVMAL